jgi:prephenate dehydrogenase
LAGRLRPDALVTDAAGTKSTICACAEKILGGSAFIGGHPMAGSEKSGGQAADPLIFHGKPYVLCPLPGVDDRKMLDLMGFVESLGAKPITLDPSEHDRLVAMISHLPQLLATTLMRTVETAAHDRELAMKIAGNGFRDMTRLAASEFDPWEGVLATNRADIERALDEFERALAEVRARLADGTIGETWRDVAAVRRRMLDRSFQPVSRSRPTRTTSSGKE